MTDLSVPTPTGHHRGSYGVDAPYVPALLLFGALITPTRLADLGWQGWALAILAIVVVRPASMLLSLIRTPMPRAERLTAAWFGPKGFASVVYGLLVLQAGIPEGAKLFDLIAVTIALSIILHSSTDVPVAHKLRIEPPDHLPAGHEPVEAPPAEHLLHGHGAHHKPGNPNL